LEPVDEDFRLLHCAARLDHGEWRVRLNKNKNAFFVEPTLDHGAVCRKVGVLVDVFSPAREDFLDEAKT
jgi:hypothetical protein